MPYVAAFRAFVVANLYDSMLDFWPLQLTRAYLGESSIARAVETGLTFHLIPCLLGVTEKFFLFFFEDIKKIRLEHTNNS